MVRLRNVVHGSQSSDRTGQAINTVILIKREWGVGG